MIEDLLGPHAEAAFLTMIVNNVDVADLTSSDYRRCIELIDTYSDLGLGLVDASIVAVAERLTITTVATLNQRDFRVVRPVHRDTLDLVP